MKKNRGFIGSGRSGRRTDGFLIRMVSIESLYSTLSLDKVDLH